VLSLRKRKRRRLDHARGTCSNRRRCPQIPCLICLFHGATCMPWRARPVGAQVSQGLGTRRRGPPPSRSACHGAGGQLPARNLCEPRWRWRPWARRFWQSMRLLVVDQNVIRASAREEGLGEGALPGVFVLAHRISIALPGVARCGHPGNGSEDGAVLSLCWPSAMRGVVMLLIYNGHSLSGMPQASYLRVTAAPAPRRTRR
jgi:hypothetical protein